MNDLLNGLHDFMVAYIDNIIVHTSNWKEHMQHLEIVFNRLRDSGLTVRKGNVHLDVVLVYTWVMWLVVELLNQWSVR